MTALPCTLFPNRIDKRRMYTCEQKGGLDDIRKIPEFAEPVPTTAKAGSALFYSSYLVHAAIPFENKRRQRALWTLSMTRGDTSRWTKLANPWSPPKRQFFQPFWEKTTARGPNDVRLAQTWQHQFYTETTLKGIAMRFPNMDLTPYQN